MIFKNKMLVFKVCATLVALFLFPSIAFAQDLPFQSNVDKLTEAMTGPIATIISLVGIVGCGAMLIFGGELSGFARTMVFLVLVISVIVQAENIVKTLGGKASTTKPVVVVQI